MAIRTLRSIAELNRELDAADAASKRSHAEYLNLLEGIVLDPQSVVGVFPPDPCSEDYRSAQLSLYEAVAGRAYLVEYEETPFDHGQMMRQPFPYCSGNPSLVGDYLMTYGNLIKTMALPLHARILEVGSGFGPLTYQLASMGHSVTCVDISESLLGYVKERTAGLQGSVQTIVCDMNNLDVSGSFDVILFFESFHHCADHLGLLRKLPKMLEPGGMLVLAGEPIVPKNTLAVPYPWGVRVDGVSLWFASRHGWLELGFEESYLNDLLERLGWTVVKKPSGPVPTMGVWMAKRKLEDSPFAAPLNSSPFRSWPADNPDLHTHSCSAELPRKTIRSGSAPGFLLFGPYTPLDAGFYEVQWCGEAEVGSRFSAEVTCNGGAKIVRSIDVEIVSKPPNNDPASLARARFKVENPASDFEFRIRLQTATDVSVNSVVLRKY